MILTWKELALSDLVKKNIKICMHLCYFTHGLYVAFLFLSICRLILPKH